MQGGFYKNSYYKTSTYGLLNLKHDMKKWRWGISFGFVTGYNNIETKRTSERKINKSHKKEHWDSKSKYKESIAYHSHPQNLNKLQFIVLPNITWKINKKHALNLTYAPDFSKDVVKFIGFNYQYTIGD